VVPAEKLAVALTEDLLVCLLSEMGSVHFQSAKCIPWSLDRLFYPNEGGLGLLYL
jgi:hypothetical protein